MVLNGSGHPPRKTAGCLVGEEVTGLFEGELVGDVLGSAVGCDVGDAVGFDVGAQVPSHEPATCQFSESVSGIFQLPQE